MSRENVELIQAQFEHFAETGRLDWRVVDPKFEWHSNDDVPHSGVHRGHEGAAAVLRDWIDSFEDFHIEVSNFIDRGEYLIVPLVIRGRIRGTDAEVARPETWVYKVRKGMIVEGHGYGTLEQALEVMGLED